MEVNTDKMVEILKKELPLNVTVVEEYGKDKLVVLFALPHLADKVIEFGNKLIEEHKSEVNSKQLKP